MIELCCVIVAPGLSQSVCVKPGNVTLLSCKMNVKIYHRSNFDYCYLFMCLLCAKVKKDSLSAANFVCDVGGNTAGFIEGKFCL